LAKGQFDIRTKEQNQRWNQKLTTGNSEPGRDNTNDEPGDGAAMICAAP
jgi:hypothetical protein